MKDLITVYIFYIVDQELSPENYPGVGDGFINFHNGYGSALYAYTTRKDIAKAFQQMRDSRKFERREEYMTAEEFEKFTTEYGQYCVMDRSYRMNVRDEKTNTFSAESTYILSTEVEYNTVMDDGHESLLDFLDVNLMGIKGVHGFITIDDVLDWIGFIIYEADDLFVKQKYWKALKLLFYDSNSMEDLLRPFEYPSPHNESPTDFIDEVALYLHIFSNTFKEGREMKCESLSFTESLTKKYQETTS